LKNVLIIEDDISIAEIERDFLEIEGFKVQIAADGISGLSLALSNKFDLIILDLMLPGISGYELCKSIREKIDIPIIMVTAKSEIVDTVRGLGLGADDYISKPFSPTELLARVKANMSQYDRLKKEGILPKSMVEAGPIRINLMTHRVYVHNKEVEFKNREFELLLLFISNPDIVFSKNQLYEKIWGMDAIGDLKTVAVHINRIREKVELYPQNPEYLLTVWGAGYRFRV